MLPLRFLITTIYDKAAHIYSIALRGEAFVKIAQYKIYAF